MRAYAEDLRHKVVEAVERHAISKSEAARLFGISLSSAKRYTKLASEGKPLSAITDQDARGFFEHCGYRVLAQAF